MTQTTRVRSKAIARTALTLLTPLWLIASACGSDEGGDTDAKCAQGDTRACLGPGQCNGAQSCTADGTWSACDCGGSGGAGGTGGTGGSSTGGSGGAGTGGAAGGDGSAGTGGSAGDASADGAGGGTQWKDDPCPTKKPIIDCSTGCGGPSAGCAWAMCYSGYTVNLSANAYPYVIRTPSKPGSYPCDAQCGDAAAPHPGMSVGFGNMTLKPTFGLKVTVPKPWFVALPNWAAADPHCVSVPQSQCVVSAVATSGIHVLTNDPNAPAVNALVEEVPWPATCP